MQITKRKRDEKGEGIKRCCREDNERREMKKKKCMMESNLCTLEKDEKKWKKMNDDKQFVYVGKGWKED